MNASAACASLELLLLSRNSHPTLVQPYFPFLSSIYL